MEQYLNQSLPKITSDNIALVSTKNSISLHYFPFVSNGMFKIKILCCCHLGGDYSSFKKKLVAFILNDLYLVSIVTKFLFFLVFSCFYYLWMLLVVCFKNFFFPFS